MSAQFLGTYPCALCPKRVRVYEWLPSCVLCAGCRLEVLRQENLNQADRSAALIGEEK